MQDLLTKRRKKSSLRSKISSIRKCKRKKVRSNCSTTFVSMEEKPVKVSEEPLVKHREGQRWFEYQVNEKIGVPPNDTLETKDLLSLEKEADILLRNDVDIHNKYIQTQGGSEATWLQTIIKKGTASDRRTAMQLQLHKSPVHSLCYIEIMIGSLEKRNTREVQELLPLLEDMFLNYILPTDRKLVLFSERPLKRINDICSRSESGRKRLLILWRFEHRLKLVYERFLRALEGITTLMVEDLCKKALRTALNLLAGCPEGEKFLLSMLVNKMGHPKSRIGAFVATLLEDLTKRHPNMRPVIVTEVERLIYRTNVSQKAHLYATTFLSQITLRTGDSDLATQMLSIYFGLFRTIVNQKIPNNRLIGILLSASNRALPFAREKADCLTEEINTLYRIVHTSSYSVALQTLKLLYTIHEISESLSERFYTSLYRKLLVDVPPSCYNQLLVLLFKVLRSDPSDSRVRVFVKRLLQVATCTTPSFAAGILILISRLLETRENLIVVQKHHVNGTNTKQTNEDIEEDEHYVDLGVDGKPIISVKDEVKNTEVAPSDIDNETKYKIADDVNFESKSGWIHRRSHALKSPYNHNARNPLFIDCRNLVDYELALLSMHYHPSVAVFAKALIEDGHIDYDGDPLDDFTLIKFLDRFAFKNPKEKSKKPRPNRVIQRKHFDPWGVRKFAVSSKEYLSKKITELPADERYLHRFASLKFNTDIQNRKKSEDEWEIESVDSDEFDALIEKFEPGQGKHCYDVDYSKEFTAEKKKSRSLNRTASDETGEDDEIDLEMDYENDSDEDADNSEEEENDDEIEDFDDVDESNDETEIESELDEEDGTSNLGTSKNDNLSDDDDSEDYIGGNDVDKAGEKFASLLEDFEEEEKAQTKNKRRNKWKRSRRGRQGK